MFYFINYKRDILYICSKTAPILTLKLMAFKFPYTKKDSLSISILEYHGALYKVN